MENKLWVGQRFLLNPRGHHTVVASCGMETVAVEIDPSVTFLLPEKDPERGLMNMRVKIQAAARQKWEADDTERGVFASIGPVRPKVITLTAEDLGL